MTFCQIQQEKRFGFGLVGLHGDACLHVVRSQLRHEMLGKKISFQHGHLLRDPAVARWIVMPEVLVGVNPHTAYRSLKNPPSTGKSVPVMKADSFEQRK